MMKTFELRRLHPHMSHPIECENGCGTILELMESMRSYHRDEKGERELICPKCAEEYGHADEDTEDDDYLEENA